MTSFVANAQQQYLTDGTICLATNIYWEARNQSFAGQIAVGLVTLNRVIDDRFPDTICEVVYQAKTRKSWAQPWVDIPIRDRCQFSWYCDGKDDAPYEEKAWEQARLVANGVYYQKLYPLVGDALWYHADYVKPEWAESKREVAQIGNHIFYERKN